MNFCVLMIGLLRVGCFLPPPTPLANPISYLSKNQSDLARPFRMILFLPCFILKPKKEGAGLLYKCSSNPHLSRSI
ncbi:hypothetical protein B0F90DRAFT_1755334 [Multifurca ochricompacta]|uniref:Secreted protein n=1 Tax=Multifurca ochricompacta TaxID=376703 RepID=A0AAD4LXV0_9AGAM|nr:hypothetical protein B0F90DRAFT_1755334 [Multifurca ochricompacta]